MQITVKTESGSVLLLEMNLELTVQDLKAILEREVAMNASQMLLIHNMVPLTEDTWSLGKYQIGDGDIIMVVPLTSPLTNPTPHQPQQQPESSLPLINWGAISVPQTPRNRNISSQGATLSSTGPNDPNDPNVIGREWLGQWNPPLAQAMESEDSQVFRLAMERHLSAVRESDRQRIRMLNADPFDQDAQSQIAQDIQRKNIEENMEAAMEYTPESFSRVVMLYIAMKVNGVMVKALVDSGAASTIMSVECAEKCGIMRLVDRRFSGFAYGLGRQKIIGKVHLGTIQIGKDFLTSSFQVLENAAEDMLLGLDMLRRHQCCIDLKNNVLCIGTTGNETPFLTEAELKEKEEMRLKQAHEMMKEEDAELAKAISSSQQIPPIDDTPLAGQANLNASSDHHPQPHPLSMGTSFPESSIQRIVEAGFSREEAIQELGRCEGSVELALTSLLAKSITL